MTLKLPPEFQAQLNKSVEHLDSVDSVDSVDSIDSIIQATPKERLKEYILATVATESTTEFSFVYTANNIDEVQAFIHKMRVALYRQRLLVKNSGRKPKQFGMKVKSIEMSGELPDESPDEPSDELDKNSLQEFTVTLSTITPPKIISETGIDKALQDLLRED